MVRFAIVAWALGVVAVGGACQVRPSDKDVFYAFDRDPALIDARVAVDDAAVIEGPGSDAAGSGSDGAVEGPGSDAGGSGSGSDAGGSGSGSGSDDGGTGDGGNGGNGPPLGNRATVDDNTSFYACSAGGFGGALVPVGAVIAIGMLRRRRRK